MVNSNPETVSTDFDTSDRLYFEPLDEESRARHPRQRGGRATERAGHRSSSSAARPRSTWPSRCTARRAPIVGSSSRRIDLAEDRRRFEALPQRARHPAAARRRRPHVEEALATAEQIGYPVLVRPSYVLGGRAMEIVQNATELVALRGAAAGRGRRASPILIDKYLEGKEVEVDAICDGEDVLIPGIMEHIERAGVHSGDSMAVYPARRPRRRGGRHASSTTRRASASALDARGLMNVQYVIMRDERRASNVYVLEVNPRASRTVPFLSKVTGVPMVRLAVNVHARARRCSEQGYAGGLWPRRSRSSPSRRRSSRCRS